MRELLLAQKCAAVNFRKWAVTPQIWVTAVVIAIFGVWNLSWVMEYSYASGIRIAPWIFPHFLLIPIMQLVYGYLTIVFFSDAPFRDAFAQFLEIRVGKKLWICGQLLYIVEAALVYSLYYMVITIVMILPRIYVTLDWGKAIEQLCYDREITSAYGIVGGALAFAPDILENFTPLQAMVLGLLMLWLVSVWIGVMIFFLHIILKKGAGIAVAGFFVFLAYFSNFVGALMFGNRIFFVSPINWVALGYLNIAGRGDLPDVWYAVSILLVSSVIMGVTGAKVYCVKES